MRRRFSQKMKERIFFYFHFYSSRQKTTKQILYLIFWENLQLTNLLFSCKWGNLSPKVTVMIKPSVVLMKAGVMLQTFQVFPCSGNSLQWLRVTPSFVTTFSCLFPVLPFEGLQWVYLVFIHCIFCWYLSIF